MPRKKREQKKLIKKYEVYCEGQTELHYLAGLKGHLHKADPSIRVKIDLTCIGGGGYKTIYNALAKQPDSSCIARFVLLDYDRYANMPAEQVWFNKLVNLSSSSCQSRVPCILIVSNEDFEYVLCCHDPNYRDGDTKQWISSQWHYSDLGALKSDGDIWNKANSGRNSLQIAAKHLKGRRPIISNEMKIDGRKVDISLRKVTHNADSVQRTSNLYDLLDTLGVSNLSD